MAAARNLHSSVGLMAVTSVGLLLETSVQSSVWRYHKYALISKHTLRLQIINVSAWEFDELDVVEAHRMKATYESNYN